MLFKKWNKLAGIVVMSAIIAIIFVSLSIARQVQTPVMISPANNASDLSLSSLLKWHGHDQDERSFLIQISLDESFESPVHGFISVLKVGSGEDVQSLSLNAFKLEYGTKYWWRVSTLNNQGTFSNWSETRSFTTFDEDANPPGENFQILTPFGNNTPLKPTYEWILNLDQPQTNLRFYLQVIDRGTNQVVYYKDNIAFQEQAAGFLERMLDHDDGELYPDREFTVRVRFESQNRNGVWVSSDFRTTKVYPNPLLPIHNATDVSIIPLFVFEPDPNSHFTEILVYSTISMTDVPATALVPSNVGEYTFPQPFNYGKRYWWTMRSVTNGQVGLIYEIRSFTTEILLIPSSIQLLSPEDKAENVGLRPTFVWNRDPNALLGYRFQLSITPDFQEQNIVKDVYLLEDSTYTMREDLQYYYRYYWRVFGVTLDLLEGPPSETRSFLTERLQLQLISPNNESVDIDLNPTLNWELIQGATVYNILIDSNPGVNQPKLYQVESNDGSFVVPDELNPNTTYYWRVTTRLGPLLFYFSDWWEFTTRGLDGEDPDDEDNPDPPSSIILAEPDTDAVNVSRRPTFTWFRDNGSDEYMLQLSTSPIFSGFVYTQEQISDTLFVLDLDLNYSTAYSWRIRGKNLAGDGEWSETRKFTTMAVPVSLDEEATLPHEMSLHPNYPNPFNPSTQIAFTVPESGNVKLSVFDLTGRLVVVLIDGKQAAGSHTLTFDASGLSSGLYVVRLEFAGKAMSRKITYMK
jgi:hypothetical protein